jgi:hypothetical protein
MRSKYESQAGALEMLVRIGITIVALAAVAALLGLFGDDAFSRWQLLVALLGASTFLVGVIGLLRKVCTGPQGSVSTVAGDIAVILAGGILLGGGWGAALGLGAIAVAGLLREPRGKADEGEPSA